MQIVQPSVAFKARTTVQDRSEISILCPSYQYYNCCNWHSFSTSTKSSCSGKVSTVSTIYESSSNIYSHCWHLWEQNWASVVNENCGLATIVKPVRPNVALSGCLAAGVHIRRDLAYLMLKSTQPMSHKAKQINSFCWRRLLRVLLLLPTKRISSPSSPGRRLKPSSSTSGEACKRETARGKWWRLFLATLKLFSSA